MGYSAQYFANVSLKILSALFFFLALAMPLFINIRKSIKEKTLEASDASLKLTFLFFLLAIVCTVLWMSIEYPIVIVMLYAVGFTVFYLFYAGVTLLQLRMIRGKGAIKRFFKSG